MKRLLLGAALLFGVSAAHAQNASARQCPMVNGLFASATTTGDSLQPMRTTARVDERGVIDTTWTFDVRERTWSWREFAASVVLGFTSGSSASNTAGTTTAPRPAAASAWSVCAAASVGMRNSTLTLRGARGTVHLRADMSQLTRAGTTVRDTTSRPRR